MSAPIADTLVLVFTVGVSLRDWKSTGMLEREWAIYERLAPFYKRMVVVTFGGPDDARIASDLSPVPRVICNDGAMAAGAYMESLAGRVAEELAGSASIVVKTNQHPSGPAACPIAEALRTSGGAGRRVALIARGGYLHSRFVAREKGPHSADAVRAAESERELFASADLVVGTTGEMVEDLSWRYCLDPSATRVIPNYVLVERAPTAAFERDSSVVLYSGQLVKRKRVDLLIEAMASLPESVRSRAVLRIIGQGPEEQRLRELAGARAVKCEFRGRVPHRQLLDEMSRCGVYAQASELEGHPKTVLEAMTSGAPVVVADSPGLGGVVQNGITGVRVSRDAEHFAHAIGALMSDDDWRATLGAAAAEWARSQFGLDRVAELEVEGHRCAVERAEKRAGAVRRSAM